MLTVAILINGKTLMARSAHNITEERMVGDSVCEYKCDDGSIITHDTKDGAVTLAKKLLDTIKE